MMGYTIELLQKEIGEIEWYLKEYAKFSTEEKNKIGNDKIAEYKKVIEMLEREEETTKAESSSHIGDIMPMLLFAEKVLECEFDEQTEEDKEAMVKIVEICESINNQFWMYKGRLFNYA